MPRVSVCIPTYNTGRYLGAAIASVLAQDFTDFDLHVCDNASTDDTADLCRQIRDSRVYYHRFDEFFTQAGNWNRALGLATGDFVVLLHADDLLEPAFLRAALAVLDAAPDAALAHCAVQHIDAAGNETTVQRLDGAAPTSGGSLMLRRLLVEGCFVNPAGVMIRRGALRAAGSFTESVTWGVDWHMWMRLAAVGSFAYLEQPLARYRDHPSSGTAAVLQAGRNAQDEQWVVDDVLARVPLLAMERHQLRPDAVRGIAHRTWSHAEQASSNGYGQAARAGIGAACRLDPRLALKPATWALAAATVLGHPAYAAARVWTRKVCGR